MALSRTTVILNGAERHLIFDKDKDDLASVLRRFGLTGVKVGCGKGQCGACSVILNGKVVRSCMKKMKDIEIFSEITTVEGIGGANFLHPIQQAMIYYGAIQCGFCSPGFVVSIKALLDENPDPSREEIRDWFTKHRNICRCTGYKPIVDAVEAAAAVLRGEKDIEDIRFKVEKGASIYNTKYPRPTAVAKVTGVADYGDDLKYKMPENTMHLGLVMPMVTSHARILSIDTSEAEKMPGVYKVVTAKDVKGTNKIAIPINHPRSTMDGMERDIIASDKIRKFGDVVAVVIANTEEEARAAAKCVKTELEPLSENMDLLEAVSPDAERVYDFSPNTYIMQPVLKGDDVEDIIESSSYSVEGSFRTTREPHLSIEGDTMQGYWDEDGNLNILCKSQSIMWNRAGIADAIGFPLDKIRMIENPTGGSFGWATAPSSYGIMGVCLMVCDKPLTLTMTYEEFMHHSGKRCPSYTNGRLSCDDEGKITALEFDMALDHGPYTEVAGEILQKIARFCGFPYNIPNVAGLCRIIATNHNNGTSYRGFGSVQAETSSEALVDMLAEKMGMDPFEFRYKNVARPGDTTINSYPYPEYPMEELFDKIRPLYYEYKERAKKESTATKKRGVGVCCAGFNVTLGMDHAEVALELNSDGTITHYNTWEEQGQGGDIGTLVLTHKALEPLGIEADQIRLVMNDSHTCPVTGIAAGSRCHYMGGNATIDAAEKLLNAMRKEDGTYRTYEEMVAENIPTKYLGVYDTTGQCVPLDPNTGVGDPTPTNMYGVFIAEVEVDTETGKTTVLNYAASTDVGVVGNYLSVDGQAYGGMSHSIGFALTEDYEDLKKHNNMAACGIPAANDIPDNMDVRYTENERAYGPFGSSGCSELFQSGNHMCIINAINDAVGVRIYELPAKPDKVKEAMAMKEKGQELKPEKYYFGSELYEELDDIKANPVVPT